MDGPNNAPSMQTDANPNLDTGLASLALIAQYFEKPGDYDDLRHRHGTHIPANESELVRYANGMGMKSRLIDANRSIRRYF